MVDVNLLIYAYNPAAEQHAAAAGWLRKMFSQQEAIGLSWLTIWAFLRITTNTRLWRRPVSADDALDRITEWLKQPNVIIVEPGNRHFSILKSIIGSGRFLGTVITDAALAAIAIEHAATLASSDSDFRKFSGLRWINPLE
jgi:toxin-antitoxin system PIN domain toxin